MNDTSPIGNDILPVILGFGSPVPEDYFRVLLVRRGALRTAGGGQEAIALARSMAVIPPGSGLRLLHGAGAEIAAVSFSRGILDPDALGREASGLLRMLGVTDGAHGTGRPAVIQRLTPEAFAEADALVRRMEAEARDRRPGYHTMLRLSLIGLLMVLYRTYASAAGREAGLSAGNARFRIEEAVAYVEDRYSEELSLPEIAGRFGLNPSYFSRVFALRTGMPLFSYVNGLRIRKSCALLKKSGLSVLEIAYAVGYNNLSHFNRYFRRIMGESPREYRKRVMK